MKTRMILIAILASILLAGSLSAEVITITSAGTYPINYYGDGLSIVIENVLGKVILQGNGSLITNNTTGIHISNSNVEIRDFVIKRNYEGVIALNSTVIIANCEISLNRDSGVILQASSGEVNNNVVSDNVSYGIDCIDVSDLKISDNTLKKNGLVGIKAWAHESNSNVEITGNTISDCEFAGGAFIPVNHGILIRNSNDFLVANNILIGNYEAIRLFKVYHSEIRDNQLVDNEVDGIVVYQSDDNFIDGNSGTSKRYGFYFQDSFSNHGINSIISDMGDIGLENNAVENSPTAVFTNSQIAPTEFQLHQNYPNPFNPVTTINYNLPVSGHSRLTIYDTRGRQVAVLVDTFKTQGNYSIEFDAREFASGIYLYCLQIFPLGSKIPAFTQTKRMTLQK